MRHMGITLIFHGLYYFTGKINIAYTLLEEIECFENKQKLLSKDIE